MIDWFAPEPHAELLRVAEVRCTDCFRDGDTLVERIAVPVPELGLASMSPSWEEVVSLPDCRCGYPTAITEHHVTYWPDESQLPGVRAARAAGGGPIHWMLVASPERPGPGPVTLVRDLGADIDEALLAHHWQRVLSVRAAWRLALSRSTAHVSTLAVLGPGLWAYTYVPEAGEDEAARIQQVQEELPVPTVVVPVDIRRGKRGLDRWAGPFTADIINGQRRAVCLVDSEEARTTLTRMLLASGADIIPGLSEMPEPHTLWARQDGVAVCYRMSTLMQAAASEALTLAEAARALTTRARLQIASTHPLRLALDAVGVHVRDLAHASTQAHAFDPRALARVITHPQGVACAAVSVIDPARAPGCGNGRAVGLLRRQGYGAPLHDVHAHDFVRVPGVQCPHALLALPGELPGSILPPALAGHWRQIRNYDGSLAGVLVVGAEMASALIWPELSSGLLAACVPGAPDGWTAWAPMTDMVLLVAPGSSWDDEGAVMRALRDLDVDPRVDVSVDYHALLTPGAASELLDLTALDEETAPARLMLLLHRC